MASGTARTWPAGRRAIPTVAARRGASLSRAHRAIAAILAGTPAANEPIGGGDEEDPMREETSRETVPKDQRGHVQLKALRDEIRVKLHLAGMDVRDRWAELEPEVDRALAKVEAATEHAVEQMVKKLQRINDSLSHR
jgi:hypothetical protein